MRSLADLHLTINNDMDLTDEVKRINSAFDNYYKETLTVEAIETLERARQYEIARVLEIYML